MNDLAALGLFLLLAVIVLLIGLVPEKPSEFGE